MSKLSAEILAQIDALQARYIHALDHKNFHDWVDTFSPDPEASYFCISAENEDSHLPIALMYDDCRDRIEDRVVFIKKIWVGTFQDYSTRHFIQRTHAEPSGDDIYAVTTNFSIIYTPETGHSEVQVAGVYQDQIHVQETGAKFKSKRAIYDTTILPRYIVYPF